MISISFFHVASETGAKPDPVAPGRDKRTSVASLCSDHRVQSEGPARARRALCSVAQAPL